MKDNGYNHQIFKEITNARQLIELQNKSDPLEQILMSMEQNQRSTTRQNNIVIIIATLTLIVTILSAIFKLSI